MKTTESYAVGVIGRIWQGQTCAYTYHFDHLPDFPEIKAGAGDFADIEDYQIIEITVSTRQTRRGHTTIRATGTVREWSSVESCRTFVDCTENG